MNAPAPVETTPWNIPNALTTLRIVLVPVFAWALLAHPDSPGWRVVTAVIFAGAWLLAGLVVASILWQRRREQFEQAAAVVFDGQDDA